MATEKCVLALIPLKHKKRLCKLFRVQSSSQLIYSRTDQ